jgi:hypothetical protein
VEFGDNGSPLIAVYSDARAWKGRPGLSALAVARVEEELDRDPETTLLLFSHPRRSAEIPAARNLLLAWGGESLMQEAVAEWLSRSPDGHRSISPGR